MKMKKLSIYITILLCIQISVKSQDIICNSVEFNLIQITDTDDIDMQFKLKVDLDLSVSRLKCDTIKLKTNVKIYQLGPENLVAYTQKDGELNPLRSWIKCQPESVLFKDTQFLTVILLDTSDANLFVSYDVIGTGFFFYIQNYNYRDVFCYHYDYEYFYPMDIPINKVDVIAPDSISIFCSHEKGVNKEDEIYLTFLNNNYFKKETVPIKNVGIINIYTPDSLVYDVTLIERKKEFFTYLNVLSSYNIMSNKNIDVLLMNWRNKKTRNAYGRVFGNHCICDYIVSSNSILHEILHMVLPSELDELSKGRYFIGESIIEWLTHYLSGRIGNIDISQEIKEQNLHDVNANHFDTWNLIYKVGPAILQKIANKSSEDVLANAIITFLQKNEKKVICYNDFLYHLQDYISTDLIKEMDLMVKDK
jgi:hypothetical protein